MSNGTPSDIPVRVLKGLQANQQDSKAALEAYWEPVKPKETV